MGKLERKSGNASFGQMLHGEILKMYRTKMLWIHLLVPLLGMTVFLLYYRISAWSDWGKISGYFQVLSSVCPVLVSLIVSLAVEQEKQAGNFQNLLSLGVRREKTLAVKLCSLLGWNLAAMLLAVCGFGFFYGLLVTRLEISWRFYLIQSLMLWISQLFCYGFHLFLNLRFSKGISIGAGVVECLLAALLLTGLGRGIWYIIPCGWGGHFADFYLQLAAGASETILKNQLLKGWAVMCGVTLAGYLLLFFWFRFYEGKRLED